MGLWAYRCKYRPASMGLFILDFNDSILGTRYGESV